MKVRKKPTRDKNKESVYNYNRDLAYQTLVNVKSQIPPMMLSKRRDGRLIAR